MADRVPISLDDFSGDFATDDYCGDNALCAKNEITCIACWGHAHRKFTGTLKSKKIKTDKAQVAVNHIEKLYRIEKRAIDLSHND